MSKRVTLTADSNSALFDLEFKITELDCIYKNLVAFQEASEHGECEISTDALYIPLNALNSLIADSRKLFDRIWAGKKTEKTEGDPKADDLKSENDPNKG